MTRDEFITKIYEIVDFIMNAKTERFGKKFEGHPHFFLIHTKEEFENELASFIPKKDTYDKYDLFYVINHMIKYELNQYDSHTTVRFISSKYIPIVIRIIDGKVHIIKTNNPEFKGSEIISINGIDIKQIISELEQCICYASNDCLNNTIEGFINNTDVLKSIPSIGNVDKITITTDKGDLSFDLNNLDKLNEVFEDKNYHVDINNDIAIITYSSCKDRDKMESLIEYLKGLPDINSYIVDIRGNGGGDSSINTPLIEYLKDKDVVVLSDSKVFSSARMCLCDLKKNGAYIIGSRPGTPVSCFGNCLSTTRLEDLQLSVRGSVTYWYYDDEYNVRGITKDSFDSALKEHPEILDIKYVDVDSEVSLTLDDYVNNHDSVKDFAINYIENKNNVGLKN